MISKEVLEGKFEFGFEDETVEAVDLAFQIAQGYKSETEELRALISSDHIFMGLLSKLDSRIFELIHTDHKKLYDATKFILGRSRPNMDRLRIFTVDGDQNIHAGIKEAKEWKDEVLRPEVLLIGILSDSRNVATVIIEEIGESTNGVRLAVARSRFELEQEKAEPVFENALAKVRNAFLDPNISTPQKHRMRSVISILADTVVPQ